MANVYLRKNTCVHLREFQDNTLNYNKKFKLLKQIKKLKVVYIIQFVFWNNKLVIVGDDNICKFSLTSNRDLQIFSYACNQLKNEIKSLFADNYS